jgi:hypothetical protein
VINNNKLRIISKDWHMINKAALKKQNQGNIRSRIPRIAIKKARSLTGIDSLWETGWGTPWKPPL